MGGAILGLIGFATVAKIRATATYDYKPGQFLVIDGGKSPDKQFAIVSGEDKSGNVGVQLSLGTDAAGNLFVWDGGILKFTPDGNRTFFAKNPVEQLK